MAYIELKNLTKSFGEREIISKINLEIEKESFTVLLGPSGCGKSTILRMIAGLEDLSSGEIYIDGEEVSKLQPSKRGLSMVFQSYALFPHLNVKENILFGLKVRGVNKKEQLEQLKKVAKLVGLEEVLENKPSQLSGGQKQRVALARAFVAKHKICLMDEPLSNLDAKLRHEMRIEIKKLQQQLKMSVIYVTHDQIEAMSMADHIILLNKGRIEQQGKPEELYDNVRTTFVGKFIGTPPMNILPIKKENENLFIDNQIYYSSINSNRITNEDKYLGVRPEDIFISKDKDGLETLVSFKDYHGVNTIIGLEVNNTSLLLRTNNHEIFKVGSRVWVNWEGSKMYIFDSNGERRDN